MAAPEFVPVKPMDDVRTYESPPRRPGSWVSVRPGDLHAPQPRGPMFGNPGPDQGYALVLARHHQSDLHLERGEKADDAVAGCVGIALKRASLFGRAPVIHDVIIAYTLWGFLDEKPKADLVTLRRSAFDEVAVPVHYAERLRLVAAVPDATLRKQPSVVASEHKADWRALLDIGALDHGHA
jgi:hypothetical protein